MKKILLGTAAFGAVVIVAAWFMGFPPANDGTEATVGAATRYQGAQMTSKDVKLGSTDVQTFIQSDVFAKLVRNPDTRATLKRLGSDAAFRETFFSKTALIAVTRPMTMLMIINDVRFPTNLFRQRPMRMEQK